MNPSEDKSQKYSRIKAAAVFLFVGAIIGGVVLWQTQGDKDVSSSNNAASQQAAVVDEPLEDQSPVPMSARQGTFMGVAPKTGSGTATLSRGSNGAYTVQLGDDFTVQEGPDLYVGFGNNGKIDRDTLLGELSAFTGWQAYAVPHTIDVSKYSQVFIYCKKFSAVFAVASLQ